MPIGLLNWPGPEPEEPQVLINVPLLLNSRIRFLPVSTTYALPLRSSTIPAGSLTLNVFTTLCAYAGRHIEPIKSTNRPIAISIVVRCGFKISIFQTDDYINFFET